MGGPLLRGTGRISLRGYRMSTYLIHFKAMPIIGSENFGRFAGAYFTNWALAENLDAAMQRVIDHAAVLGWQFDERKDVHIVTRDSHLSDAELLAAFDTVQTLGVAAIIDTFALPLSELN